MTHRRSSRALVGRVEVRVHACGRQLSGAQHCCFARLVQCCHALQQVPTNTVTCRVLCAGSISCTHVWHRHAVRKRRQWVENLRRAAATLAFLPALHGNYGHWLKYMHVLRPPHRPRQPRRLCAPAASSCPRNILPCQHEMCIRQTPGSWSSGASSAAGSCQETLLNDVVYICARHNGFLQRTCVYR